MAFDSEWNRGSLEMFEFRSFGLVCGKARVGGNKAEPGDQLGTYCTRGDRGEGLDQAECGEDHDKS